jgi:hypothetical protein
MAQIDLSKVLADMNAALIETIGTVCQQLADKGALDRAVLIRSLEDAQRELHRRDVGLIGLSIPAGVAAVLTDVRLAERK